MRTPNSHARLDEIELETHAELARLLISAIHDRDHELRRPRFTPNSLAVLQRHIELELVRPSSTVLFSSDGDHVCL